jgi:ribonuclease D
MANEKSNGCWRNQWSQRPVSLKKQPFCTNLCRLRDRIAKRITQPLFKVFNDRVLIELAIECPRTNEEMVGLELLNSRQIKQDGKQLSLALNKGLAASTHSTQNRSQPPQ